MKNLHRLAALAALTVLASRLASAQTAIVSSEGDGLFRAPATDLTSVLTFKSDDTSVKLSFATPRTTGTKGEMTYGGDVTVKSSQGLAAVLKTGTYTPGSKVNGYLLRHSLLTDVKTGGDVDWLVLQGSLSVSQLVLFDPDRAFSDQISKSTFVGMIGQATYAYERAGWALLGLTGGFDRTNNYADMKDIVVSTQKTYRDSATGSVRATEANQTSAKQGTYVDGLIGSFRADLFMYPTLLAERQLGITAYESSRLSTKQSLRRSDVGVGLAVLKKGSPTVSLGAFVIEARDIFNSQGSDVSLGRRIAVSLQGSVPIAPRFGF